MKSSIESLVLKDHEKLNEILQEMGKVVVGQQEMNRALLVGLLTGGHILLEGLPGLAKTLAVKTLAQTLNAQFHRVQFTPDLLPSDLIGTMVYVQQTSEFKVKKGPLFTNLLLADEINRAPAKVQSALLEAMAEKQVTLGEGTYPLEEPFLVLATQNPIEQEGTYPLPEAQLDRFLFMLKVTYPSPQEEMQILERMGHLGEVRAKTVFSISELLEIRKHVDEVFCDDRLKNYIIQLVTATRPQTPLSKGENEASRVSELRSMISFGASPRATLGIYRSAKAFALLDKRHFVIPEDIKHVASLVLRHRLILTFESQANRVSKEDVLDRLLHAVGVP